jgi:hypothetical protein
VTKGSIDFNRYSAQVRADYYLAGHVHRMNTDISTVLEVDAQHKKLRRVDVDFVRMSTFKEEGVSPAGWHVERGMGPRPIGGWWCEWHCRDTRGSTPRLGPREGTCRVVYAVRRFVRAI